MKNHKHDECCHHLHHISYDDYFNVGEHVLICCHQPVHEHCCHGVAVCIPTHSPAACKQHMHPKCILNKEHHHCHNEHKHCHECCPPTENHFLFDADNDGFVEGAIIKRPLY